MRVVNKEGEIHPSSDCLATSKRPVFHSLKSGLPFYYPALAPPRVKCNIKSFLPRWQRRVLLTELLSRYERQGEFDFVEETRLGRSKTRFNPHNEDEKFHTSQELQSVDQETSGSNSKSEAKSELSGRINGRSTGEPRKGTLKEMNSQSAPLYAFEIAEAVCGFTKAFKSVAELTQKTSSAICHAEN